VMMLDMVTLGGSAFVRALVPLSMAIAFGVLVTLSGALIKRLLSRSKKGSAS